MLSHSPRLARCLFLTASLGVAVSRPALAQNPNDSASAQALFDQARQLMAAGNYGAACPKLEESQRLDPGSGTLLNLGDCYEQDGKLATAWSKFLEAASAAHVTGNAERENTARSRAAALSTKLSKIVIEVPGASNVKGLEVRRDGIGVGAAQWGAPMPADDGKHTVSASAPGRKPWVTTVTVARGQGLLTVPIPELEIDPEAGKSAPPGAAPSGSPGHDTPSSSGLGTQKTLALVAGGIGVVGVGVGTVFGLQSKSKHDEADQHCSGSDCRDQTGVDLRKDARSAGDLATVGFVIGAAGLVGGAVLWFTAGSSSDAPATRVGLGPGRVTLWHTW